jgi:hypothetical protein
MEVTSCQAPLAFVQVPVAYNAGTGCPLWGTYRPWTPAKIQSLYSANW